MPRKNQKSFIWFIVLMVTTAIVNSCTLLNLPATDLELSGDTPTAPVSEQGASVPTTFEPTTVNLPNTSTITITPTSETSQIAFNDDRYRLAFEYPSYWSLSIIPAGRQTGTGFSAKTLQLVKGDTKLVIQYNFLWDETKLGGKQPPGNLEIQGFVTLLGRQIPKHVIVAEGSDRYVFFGDSLEDLSFHIHLEAILSNPTDYSSADIPDDLQAEAAEIVASLVRTGNPLPSPTSTPIPTITPIPTRSSPGNGQTGPPVKLGPCYKATYIGSITAGNGTTIAPGAQITKIWRVMNSGHCVWSTGFKLVLAKGTSLDKIESIPIPANILPGETVDIEVNFIAPETLGNYKSSWLFNDSYGNWFGHGENQSGYIPLDINVAMPVPPYAYDFSLHYCDAVWQNSEHKEDEKAPCPGSSTSTTGFVILLNDPHLENRTENELAIWIHPLEEQNGWFQGTYSAFKVKAGDHFISWVGCMADNPKCSLVFYLNYKDNAGAIHNLGKWPESIDGKITMIDIDLSSLAGKSVQFILKTEANTHNVESAQGFWFVPRIQR